MRVLVAFSYNTPSICSNSGWSGETSIFASESQLLNSFAPMEVRPSGSVMAVREPQPKKAESPMEVRPSGSATEVRDLQ